MCWNWFEQKIPRSTYLNGLKQLIIKVERDGWSINPANCYICLKDDLTSNSRFKFQREYILYRLSEETGITDKSYLKECIKPYHDKFEEWINKMSKSCNISPYLKMLELESCGYKKPHNEKLIHHFSSQLCDFNHLISEDILYEGECNEDPTPLLNPPRGYTYQWDMVDSIRRKYYASMALKRLEWRFLQIFKLPNHDKWVRELTSRQVRRLNKCICLSDVIKARSLPNDLISEIGMIMCDTARNKIAKISSNDNIEHDLFTHWTLLDQESIVLLANQSLVNGKYQRVDLLNLLSGRINHDPYIKHKLREIAAESHS